MAPYISLSAADRIYQARAEVQFQQTPVPHAEFKSYSAARQRFLRRLGEAARDDYWEDYCRWLSRFRFRCMTAPLPFNHPMLHVQEGAARFRRHLDACDRLYPGMGAEAVALVDHVQRLGASGENPLMEALRTQLHTLGGKQDTALVVRDFALFESLENLVKSYGVGADVELVSPHQLRGRPYKRVILTGPAHWYPEHLFTAPRAPHLIVIHYNWVPGRRTVTQSFVGPQLEELQPHHPDVDVEQTETENDPFSISAVLDISHYLRPIYSTDGGTNDAAEVNARLLVLEGDIAVFLEADATTLVIDPEGTGHKMVARKAVSNIETGMFLLLKQGGGGDYIVPIADSLMGERAIMARQTQRSWKRRLRSVVDSHGLQHAAALLQRQGAQRANESNLRNWLSETSIRPWDYRDFAAIMHVVGDGADAQDYWAIMGTIDTAHTRAGQLIRRQLLGQVSHSDIQNLERVGRMDFTINVASDVSMTAYRILKVLPDQFKVSASRLGRPFNVKE